MDEQEKINFSESKPRVHLFGEELGSKKEDKEEGDKGHDVHYGHDHWHHRCRHCHGSHDGALWGLLILLGGILLLLSNTGFVGWQFWHVISGFWPLILVFVGLQIILGHSWISRVFIFIIALAVILAVILYGLIQTASPLVNHLPPEMYNFANTINHFIY